MISPVHREGQGRPHALRLPVVHPHAGEHRRDEAAQPLRRDRGAALRRLHAEPGQRRALRRDPAEGRPRRAQHRAVPRRAGCPSGEDRRQDRPHPAAPARPRALAGGARRGLRAAAARAQRVTAGRRGDAPAGLRALADQPCHDELPDPLEGGCDPRVGPRSCVRRVMEAARRVEHGTRAAERRVAT